MQTPKAAIPDHRPHTGPRGTYGLQEPPSLGTQRLSTAKASVLGHPKSTPTWAITQLTSVQPQGPFQPSEREGKQLQPGLWAAGHWWAVVCGQLSRGARCPENPQSMAFSFHLISPPTSAAPSA